MRNHLRAFALALTAWCPACSSASFDPTPDAAPRERTRAADEALPNEESNEDPRAHEESEDARVAERDEQAADDNAPSERATEEDAERPQDDGIAAVPEDADAREVPPATPATPPPATPSTPPPATPATPPPATPATPPPATPATPPPGDEAPPVDDAPLKIVRAAINAAVTTSAPWLVLPESRPGIADGHYFDGVAQCPAGYDLIGGGVNCELSDTVESDGNQRHRRGAVYDSYPSVTERAWRGSCGIAVRVGSHEGIIYATDAQNPTSYANRVWAVCAKAAAAGKQPKALALTAKSFDLAAVVSTTNGVLVAPESYPGKAAGFYFDGSNQCATTSYALSGGANCFQGSPILSDGNQRHKAGELALSGPRDTRTWAASCVLAARDGDEEAETVPGADAANPARRAGIGASLCVGTQGTLGAAGSRYGLKVVKSAIKAVALGSPKLTVPESYPGVAAGHYFEGSASCPAGYKLLGGGVRCDGGSTILSAGSQKHRRGMVMNSYPSYSGNTWYGSCGVAASRTDGYEVDSAAHVPGSNASNPAGYDDRVFAICYKP